MRIAALRCSYAGAARAKGPQGRRAAGGASARACSAGGGDRVGYGTLSDGRRRGAQVIKLSDAVQALPRQVTCCVHGAAPGFVTAGAAKARSAEGAGRRFSKGAYCLAKVVWGKGWEELLELMEYQGRVAAARGEVRASRPALVGGSPVVRAPRTEGTRPCACIKLLALHF